MAVLLRSMLLSAAAATAMNTTRICYWNGVRAGVVRDALYLEGGLLAVGNWSNNQYQGCEVPSNRYGILYRLNFSRAFDATQDTLWSLLDPLQETINGVAPTYSGGTMFADTDEWYTFGGVADFGASNTSRGEGIVWNGLYQSNTMANPDTQYVIENSDVLRWVTGGSGVSVPSESLGFYFSGFRSANSTPISFYYNTTTNEDNPNTIVSNMLKVDTQSYNKAKWSEIPLPSGIEPRGGASTIWLPVGAQGALAVIGGSAHLAPYTNGLTDDQRAENNQKNPTFVVEIPIYDIANDKWYLQRTSGTSPIPFTEACAVVATSKDKSSHQVFVHGGWDANGDNLPSDEVWVLSIPAFTWIRVSAGDPQHARYRHVCFTPYPDQMITVAGVAFGDVSYPNGMDIDIFNLNSLQWTHKYDPTVYEDYKVHTAINSVIGGNEDGGASTYASDMDTQLRSLLAAPYTGAIPFYGPYTSTSMVAAPPSSSKPAWMVPVIAVIVTLIGVTIVGALARYLCLTHKAKQRKRRAEPNQETPENNPGSHGVPSSWIRAFTNSHYAPVVPKSVVSEDRTEIDSESTSPRFEVPGFTFYKERPVEADSAPISAHARMQSIQTSPSPPVSELPSEGHPSPPLFDRTGSNYSLKDHHMYPHAFASLDLYGSTSSSSSEYTRFANARPPAREFDVNAQAPSLPYELASTRSRIDLRQTSDTPPHHLPDQERSATDSATSIPESTDLPSQSRSPLEAQLPQTPPLNSTENAQMLRRHSQGPPPALSTRNAHQRNNSSQNSLTFSLTSATPDQRGSVPTISPGEEKRRSDHLNSLPERSLPQRNVAAMVESVLAATSGGQERRAVTVEEQESRVSGLSRNEHDPVSRNLIEPTRDQAQHASAESAYDGNKTLFRRDSDHNTI